MSELRGDPAGVVGRVERAAALLELGVRVGDVVQAHPDADDLLALLVEQRGGDRRIDPARHRDEHARHRQTPNPGTNPAAPWPSGSAASAAEPMRSPASVRGTISAARSTSLSVVVRPSVRRTEPRASSSGEAHRRQHVRHLGGAGRAGRPHRARDPLEVQRQGDGRAVHLARDERQMARQPLARMARQLRAVDREHRRPQAVAVPAQPARRLGSLQGRELVGAGHADRAGDVLRARPPVALLGAALLLGQDVRPVADVQRADALGPLELVGRERDQVRAQRLEVEVELAPPPAPRRRGAARPGWAPTRAAISGIGWMVPTSLLAYITDTRIVLSVIAASTASGSTRP